MNTLNRVTHLLDRIIAVALKILIVALVLGYGGVIFFAGLAGYRTGHYRMAEVYTFDHIAFSCGETTLEVEKGSLVTARRAGEVNYAILMGDIRAEWPPRIQQWSQVPPATFHQLRLSFNPDDLHRLLEENRTSLRQLLKYETDANYLREQAAESFDWAADRFQPLLLPQVDFFRPPPVGTMDLAILDEGLGWTLITGKMDRVGESWAAVSRSGGNIARTLLSGCALLIVLVVASACLGNIAHVVVWVRSLVRGPARFAEAPGRHLLSGVVVLLVAGALIVILRIM